MIKNVAIIVLAITTSIFIFLFYHIPEPEPEYMIVERTKYITQEVVEYVETPVEYQEFSSEAELGLWLKDNPISDKAIFIPLSWNCIDYAVHLTEQAWEDGFKVGLYGDGKNSHMMNFTLIDGGCWLIEPQTREYWFLGYID